MDGDKHHVIFARKSYDEPLTELGTVQADNDQQARELALDAYPDDDWLEMVAVPHSALIPVFPDE